MNAITNFNIDLSDKNINIKEFVNDIKVAFYDWDTDTKLSADRLLYQHLQKCFALALACETEEHVKTQLKALLKEKNITLRKDNSVFSPILLFLFPGDDNRRRRSSYNSVMLEAKETHSEKPTVTKADDFAMWVEDNGGLEVIRIKRLTRLAEEAAATSKPKKKKKRTVNIALRAKAQTALTKKQPIVPTSISLPTMKQEGELLLVVCKVSADGTITIIEVVDDESADAVWESVGDKLPDTEIMDAEGRSPMDQAIQKAAENYAQRQQ